MPNRSMLFMAYTLLATPCSLHLPKAPDLFFRPGVEGRRLFHRGANGRVDALIDRRNNQDVVWKKL